MSSNSDDFIQLPSNDLNASFWTYDNLILNKVGTIKGNFNVKESLEIKNFSVKQNGEFFGNINILNYTTRVKNNLTINGNLNIEKNILKLYNNIHCNNHVVNITKNSSNLYINKNINVKNNFESGNLVVLHNTIFNNILNVNNNLNISNNLVAYNFNIDTINTIIDQEFLIEKNINLEYLNIKDDFNLEGQLNTDYATITNNVECKNININDGLLQLGPNLSSIGSIKFDEMNQHFLVKINDNHNYIFNDFYEKNNKSFIEANSNKINFYIENKKILDISDNINLNFNTNVNNLKILSNTNIDNNLNSKPSINNKDFCIVKSGYIKIPFKSSKTYKGSLCYNNDTKEINILYGNIWDSIKFLDTNNTGIDINDDTYEFKIYNNNIITFNNNLIEILNNTIFNNNLNIHNLYVSNNLNLQDKSFIGNNILEKYKNILRVFDKNTNKYESITQQTFQSEFKQPYKSSNFYLHDVNTIFQYLNTNNTLDNNIIINQIDYFIYELIHTDTYITNLLLQNINYNQNNFTIQILKNNILYKELNINTNTNNNLIKIDNELYYKKNDLLSIKIKSNIETNNQSLLLNLQGYNISNIELKGSTNFINDCPITFSNTNNFNVNTNIYKNINTNNIFITNNQINTNKLSLSEKKIDSSLLQIKDLFTVHNDSRISIGSTNKSNALITINNNNINNNLLEINGDILLKSNLNVLNDLNTTNMDINKIDSYNYFIKNDINYTNLLNSYDIIKCNNVITNSKINLHNNLININNLVINRFNEYYNNLLKNNSVYLSISNNNNILLTYNINNSKIKYIYHNNINYDNNVYDFNKILTIKNNSINILSNSDNSNILNIDSSLNIKNDGSFVINKDLLVNNLNYSNKIKSLLYDIYGPKNINYIYNLSTYNILLYSGNTLYETISFDNSYITTIYKNDLYFDVTTKKPFYTLKGYNIEIDVLYIKDVVLINNQIRSFTNNINFNNIILNNPYNFSISYVILNNGKSLYPVFNNNNIVNYGLKVEIK